MNIKYKAPKLDPFVKSAKFISEGVDSILLKIDSENFAKAERFFKFKDRKPVKDVIETLNDRGFDSYLTGGVLDNYLFGDLKKYGDVDILGTTNSLESFNRNQDWFLNNSEFFFEEELKENIRTINESMESPHDLDNEHREEYLKSLKKYSVELEQKKTELEQKKILVGDTNFSIKRLMRDGGYVSVLAYKNSFIMRPRIKGLRRVLGQPSDIDVSLIPSNELSYVLQRSLERDKEKFNLE